VEASYFQFELLNLTCTDGPLSFSSCTARQSSSRTHCISTAAGWLLMSLCQMSVKYWTLCIVHRGCKSW